MITVALYGHTIQETNNKTIPRAAARILLLSLRVLYTDLLVTSVEIIINGPSFSIEVIGGRAGEGTYLPFQSRKYQLKPKIKILS